MIPVCLWEAKCFQQCPDGKTSWCVVASHFHMAGWNPVWETTILGLSPGNPHTCATLSAYGQCCLNQEYNFGLSFKCSSQACDCLQRQVTFKSFLLLEYEDHGGPLLLWCRQRGVKTCHSLVTVMSVSNEHQSCSPPRWRQRACLTRSVSITAHFLVSRTLTCCDTGNSETGFVVFACLFYCLSWENCNEIKYPLEKANWIWIP